MYIDVEVREEINIQITEPTFFSSIGNLNDCGMRRFELRENMKIILKLYFNAFGSIMPRDWLQTKLICVRKKTLKEFRPSIAMSPDSYFNFTWLHCTHWLMFSLICMLRALLATEKIPFFLERIVDAWLMIDERCAMYKMFISMATNL